MSSVPSILALVVFRNAQDGGKQQPAWDSNKYRPHIVIGDRDQTDPVVGGDGRTLIEDYLPVVFSGDGQVMEFDKEWPVELRLWHPGADYSGLVTGTTFTIREAGHIVGSGKVVDGPFTD